MRIVFMGMGWVYLTKLASGVGKCPDVSHHPTIGDII